MDENEKSYTCTNIFEIIFVLTNKEMELLIEKRALTWRDDVKLMCRVSIMSMLLFANCK